VAPPTVQRYLVEPRRGLSVGERQEVAAIAQARPAIDLTIYFDYNSAEVGPKAVPALVELGRALSSDALKGTRFLLAGHTDAKGSDTYNLKLSQRRADAIKQFLMTQFRVDEQRLLAIGYGKEQPKNTADPLADENRRVQVVNFGG
jgi:outer membrane protein OmpA-like peptidoglycan-associated protein